MGGIVRRIERIKMGVRLRLKMGMRGRRFEEEIVLVRLIKVLPGWEQQPVHHHQNRY
jgi:hypothetical protein